MSVNKGKKTVEQLYVIIEELVGEQRRLVTVVEELHKEHEELKDEIRIQNFVLNSIPFRTEVLN